MTNQTINTRGATKFTDPPRHAGRPQGAVVFTDHRRVNCVAGEWDRIIGQICSFRDLADDWDGNDSAAPPLALVRAAMRLVSDLKRYDHPSPARVVAGVNGTISLEYPGQPFTEIEVISADEARMYEDGRRTSVIAI